jgi:trk system potassium uptake protein
VRLEVVFFVLGWILVFFSLMMLPSIAMALWFGSGAVMALCISLLLTLVVGGALGMKKPDLRDSDITIREGFLIVSGSWFLCSGFGAFPFFLAETFVESATTESWLPLLASVTNSVFESASGLTTTGASVLQNFDQPHGILFWRSTLHWLGGMGIIVLSLAILPLIGAGGMQLFKAEVPGPVKDRLKPRIADTAITLSKVYVFISFLETVALMVCGMNLYEALCHTFGTVATGGFSTHAQSVGGYNSHAVNLVITFFMIVAGANFALHYRFLKGEWNVYAKSGEFLTYIVIIVIATAGLLIFVSPDPTGLGLRDGFVHSIFQSVSIVTTTGYCSLDYETWPPFTWVVLFCLMFVGGCAGSTGGGMKVIRVILLFKIAFRELKRLVYPASVVVIKQDGKPVSEKVINGVAGFFVLVFIVFVFSCLLLSAFGLDYVTALTATAACLFNIGPGFGLVGPHDNYAHLPLLVKWWLVFCMIAGRLELYSVLILLSPNFWRK